MTGIAWELLVAGLLLYGLSFLGYAATTCRGATARPGNLDHWDAPIFVTRRGSAGTSATMTTRTGTFARLEA